MNDFAALSARAENLLSRLEGMVSQDTAEPEWEAIAFRWRKQHHNGFLKPVAHPHRISLDLLQGIETQKKSLDQNTWQFVNGHPANNVLLTGARGTGKSSLIKAMLDKYADAGLRLIEVEKHDLTDLQDIVEKVYRRPERFILYCDDLSFEAGEPGYKALKVVLDGSVAAGKGLSNIGEGEHMD